MAMRKYLLVALPLILSCCENSGYQEAVRNAMHEIPCAGAFNKIYPKANCYISDYNTSGPRAWNSETFFYNRYVLQMQVEVVFDSKNLHVAKFGEPKYFLVEYVSVDLVKGSSVMGQALEFGKADWDKLAAAHGDISVLGIKILKSSPVPGFEKIEEMSVAAAR